MYKVYTEEFRRMAVDLSYTSEKPVAQICRELGLSGSLIYKWRKDMGNEPKNQDSQEVKELKKKLANAEVENQIQTLRVNHHLKKALAICNRM